MKTWKQGWMIWIAAVLMAAMVAGCGGLTDDELVTIDLDSEPQSTFALKGVEVEFEFDAGDIEEIESELPGDVDAEIYYNGKKVATVNLDGGTVAFTPNKTGHFNVKVKLTNGLVAAVSKGHTLDVFKPFPGTVAGEPAFVMAWDDFADVVTDDDIATSEFFDYVAGANNLSTEQQIYLDDIGVGEDSDVLIEAPTVEQNRVYADYSAGTIYLPVQVNVDNPPDSVDYGYLLNILDGAFDPLDPLTYDFVGESAEGTVVVYEMVAPGAIVDLFSPE